MRATKAATPEGMRMPMMRGTEASAGAALVKPATKRQGTAW